MQYSKERILTTHAGSLPRPTSLSALHVDKFAGKTIDEDVLKQAIEDSTRIVIDKQIQAGMDIVNNGEMGRESFFTYVQHRMTGFGGASSRPIMADLTRYPDYLKNQRKATVPVERVNLLSAPKAVSEISYSNAAPIEQECHQLKRLLDEKDGRFTEAFISSPSPGIIAAAMQNEHYAELDEYVNAVARALRTEYKAIAEAGFILQIDAPDLALERHTLFQDKPLEDFLAFVRIVVAAINKALDGILREQVRFHVCWGNYEGPHEFDVPLEEIWSEISKINVGAVMLSMANPRHAHEYHYFEESGFPGDRLLIPGVIDTTTNYIEHPLVVADRIESIAKAVGDPHRIIAGTDCGFETSAGFVTVNEAIAWEKLRSLSEGAAIASKRLLG